ncbi:hypothetical protein AGLY_015693, partial [Aphis glycines]
MNRKLRIKSGTLIITVKYQEFGKRILKFTNSSDPSGLVLLHNIVYSSPLAILLLAPKYECTRVLRSAVESIVFSGEQDLYIGRPLQLVLDCRFVGVEPLLGKPFRRNLLRLTKYCPLRSTRKSFSLKRRLVVRTCGAKESGKVIDEAERVSHESDDLAIGRPFNKRLTLIVRNESISSSSSRSSSSSGSSSLVSSSDADIYFSGVLSVERDVTTLELRELRLFVSICCCLIRLSITDLGTGNVKRGGLGGNFSRSPHIFGIDNINFPVINRNIKNLKTNEVDTLKSNGYLSMEVYLCPHHNISVLTYRRDTGDIPMNIENIHHKVLEQLCSIQTHLSHTQISSDIASILHTLQNWVVVLVHVIRVTFFKNTHFTMNQYFLSTNITLAFNSCTIRIPEHVAQLTVNTNDDDDDNGTSDPIPRLVVSLLITSSTGPRLGSTSAVVFIPRRITELRPPRVAPLRRRRRRRRHRHLPTSVISQPLS